MRRKLNHLTLDQWINGDNAKALGIDRSVSKPLKSHPEKKQNSSDDECHHHHKSQKKTYPQQWTAYNQAQTQEKILFLELLFELCQQIPKPKRKGPGRPPADFGEMVFACCLKTYLDFSSRRSGSDMQIAQHLGYLETVPHFNTILKYLRKQKLSTKLKKLIEISSIPLKEVEEDFTVDASGFSTVMYGQWLKQRGKSSGYKKFKKAHVMSGVKTNIITHIEVTDGYVHDSRMFELLVRSTAEHFLMKQVSADKAYSSQKNVQLIASIGAIPFIPFKKNVRANTRDSLFIWREMHRFFKEHKEEFLKEYHKRSNAESVFSMMKRKFGDRVRAKDTIAQENEVLCKALCHNICVLIQEMFELGVTVDFSEIVDDEFMCKFDM